MHQKLVQELVYAQYKKLVTFSQSLDFRINDMHYYKLVTTLEISLNSLATSLDYQISTRTRNKLIQLIKKIQITPVQTTVFDTKSNQYIEISEMLILSVAFFDNEKREKCVALQFSASLFCHLFTNPIIYTPNFVPDFLHYLKQKDF